MSVTKGLLFVTTCVLIVTICSGDGSLLFPFGTTNGDTVLPGGDDVSVRTDLTTPFLFYGISLNPIYVSTNGIITDRSDTDFTPDGDISDPTNYAWPTISPFHYDLKTDASGFFFRETSGTIDLQRATTYVRELFESQSAFSATSLVIITWFDFTRHGESSNEITMQVALVSSDTVNVVLFLYDKVNITFNRRRPVIGVTAGDGINYEELNVSRTADVLTVDERGQASILGLYGFIVKPDVDECALGTANCSSIAVCENARGSFTCNCTAGYSGDGVTCSDVDECALGTANCSSIAVCENTRGSFTCNCIAGYSGDGVTCSDINECTLGTHTCKANKICFNTVGSYFCRCKRG